MRELIYTILDLKKESRKTCDFCSSRYGKDNKSVNEIITRHKATNELVGADVVCEECGEKYLNDELPKCNNCGRLQTKHYIDVLSGKYICYCVLYNEDLEEKKLPDLPYESQATFYERQINELREELTTAEEELEIEREEVKRFHETSKEWSERQKKEIQEEKDKEKIKLQKRIEELERENGTYKEEIGRLKELVKQLSSNEELETKIEQSPKNKP